MGRVPLSDCRMGAPMSGKLVGFIYFGLLLQTLDNKNIFTKFVFVFPVCLTNYDSEFMNSFRFTKYK